MPASTLLPLLTECVQIDEDCTGVRWIVQDDRRLACLIALIAMGQATFAAHILTELLPAAPAFSKSTLIAEAIVTLTVQETKQMPRTGYPRWQRDGFIFEAISWIAAQQDHGDKALLLDPHVRATSQGIDGLLICVSNDKSMIENVTILEDKCSENPRETFLQQVIPTFLDHHSGKRGSEVVAAATVLLRMGGFDNASAATLAAAVTDPKRRNYHAAFALTEEYDSINQRQRLFKDYNRLDGLTEKQRIGASFIVDGELRDWFDQLAVKAIEFLGELEAEEMNV